MDYGFWNKSTVIAALAVVVGVVLAGRPARAHCDRVNGPVAKDARKALDEGDFEEIAIWVGEEQEKELKKRFQQCLDVYEKGGESRELAERYFMETAVRLHRAAEGMPYTSLKPAQPVPEDIAAAEKALKTGDVEPVTDLLAEEMEKNVEKWFKKARDARKDREESVEEGREWTDAYVRYVIYVHGLYKAIQAGPKHGVGGE
ncbi:MAG: DUF6448 family protein [Planctomycetota bacterium]